MEDCLVSEVKRVMVDFGADMVGSSQYFKSVISLTFQMFLEVTDILFEDDRKKINQKSS